MRKALLTILPAFLVYTLFAQNGTPVPGACGSGSKNPVPMNGSATLGMTENRKDCGLNFVVANQIVETRYNQYTQATPPNLGTGLPTTVSISGIPSCATIVKAYVWYIASYQSGTAPATTVGFTNTTPTTANVAATNIGTDQGKCWGEVGSAVYRADVTANIAGGGNGNYGINITGFTNPNWEVDGVTLMIIYKDNSATYQGSIVIWDGCHTGVGNNYTQTMTGVNACGAGTNGKAWLLVSDMQDNVNSNAHPSVLNGATANYPNKFWCWDQTNTTVTSGQASANYGTDGLGSDCFTWAMMGLYYQTTTCTTCTPSAISLTVTPTPSTCGAPNGSAVAAVSGTNPPYTYAWNPGGQTTTSVNGLSAGTYSVSVTDATGCSTIQSFTITSSIGPTVTFTPTNVSCNGGTNGSALVNATGGQAPYTYGWLTTPPQSNATATGLAAGTYSVVVSDASGCSATYTVAITQPAALAATATVVANASCFGSADGSALGTGSGGTGPYSYAWTPTGQNTQTASGLPAGTYSVVVTDANGCSKSAPATITQPTQITMTQTSVAAACGVATGSASVNPSGGTGPYSFLWLTSPVQTSQTINNLAAGVYTVLVTDVNGCTAQMSVTVGGGNPPTAAFTNNPDTVNLMDATIYFQDLSSSNVSSWLWDFGDPNSPGLSSLQNPNHNYSDTGIYCITLIVTDQGGICRDTTVHCIKVEAPYTFYIPNCFTPNSDGFNEFFFAVGTYIKDFDMMLFDRWGNKIWTCHTAGEPQKDMKCYWDGVVQDAASKQLVQEDVYVWKVKLIDANNKKHTYIGRVSVVR